MNHYFQPNFNRNPSLFNGSSSSSSQVDLHTQSPPHLEDVSKEDCLCFQLEIQEAIKRNNASAIVEHSRLIFSSPSAVFDATGPLDRIQAAVDALGGVSTRKMRLRLICQYSYEPVGEGYLITVPRDFQISQASLGIKLWWGWRRVL